MTPEDDDNEGYRPNDFDFAMHHYVRPAAKELRRKCPDLHLVLTGNWSAPIDPSPTTFDVKIAPTDEEPIWPS